MVSTLEEAFALGHTHPDVRLLGEVNGIKPDGFDFGNSPSLLSTENLTDITLVQRTTAGTQGIVGSKQADLIVTGAFINAKATARYLLKTAPQDVTFVSRP